MLPLFHLNFRSTTNVFFLKIPIQILNHITLNHNLNFFFEMQIKILNDFFKIYIKI
jgi:hypothetical protein